MSQPDRYDALLANLNQLIAHDRHFVEFILHYQVQLGDQNPYPGNLGYRVIDTPQGDTMRVMGFVNWILEQLGIDNLVWHYNDQDELTHVTGPVGDDRRVR